MLRKQLVDVLSSVSGALGSVKEPGPILPCFCSTGEKLFAYDETAALETKIALPWKGGVRGADLLSWLKAATAKEVELSVADSKLYLKAGRAKFDTQILPETEFLFAPPDLSKAPAVKLAAGGILALRRATLSMGEDIQHPWRCGIQAKFGEKDVTFYAASEATAARAVAEATVPKALRTAAPLLPPRFVSLLLADAGLDVELYVTDAWFAAKLGNGNMLYSAVREGSNVETFDSLFADVPTLRKKVVPLPKTWWGALSRASVILSNAKDAPATCEIKDGKMILTALSATGQSRDSFKLDAEHANVTVKMSPAIVAKAINEVDTFAIESGKNPTDGSRLYFGAKDKLDLIVAAES